jgi:L-amino acid N-acyltransferase YncA
VNDAGLSERRIGFEYAPPSTEDIANRIQTITAQFPWLVLEDYGVIAGYAYATRHRERAAYGWSVDTAVYVDPHHHRCGVGRALYTTLFQLLRLQGYDKACAGITLPKGASTGLHEAVGFKPEIALQPERSNPDPPVPVPALAESPGWAEAMLQGLRHYRTTARLAAERRS